LRALRFGFFCTTVISARRAFAQRTNLIAGGSATGFESVIDPTLKGSNFTPLFFDPFRVGAGIAVRFPWALPTAIQFNRFAVVKPGPLPFFEAWADFLCKAIRPANRFDFAFV
jgi:hypothetical protein